MIDYPRKMRRFSAQELTLYSATCSTGGVHGHGSAEKARVELADGNPSTYSKGKLVLRNRRSCAMLEV